MEQTTVFILAASCMSVVYGVIAGLFLVRRNRKQISIRSPLLVLISTVGNYCEQICLIVILTGVISSTKLALLQAIIAFFHFLYYFPYLLRGYRLYFVFHSDVLEDREAEMYFLRHIQRAKQTWLIKVLVIMMLPVVIFCTFMLLMLTTSHVPSKVGRASPMIGSISMAISFCEEMLLVALIYSLRSIDRDFTMNQELVIITCLWYLNLALSFFMNYVFWMMELLCRNMLIMGVSVLWPLLKSYNKPDMKEILTLESLYNLPIVLQNEIPFDFFERFLNKLRGKDGDEGLDSAGTTVLRLYLMSEVYKDSPTTPAAFIILSDFQELNKRFQFLSESHISELLVELENVGPGKDLLAALEDSLYEVLHNHFFKLFLKSRIFRELCKCVEKMELRASKITNTSLYGRESF